MACEKKERKNKSEIPENEKREIVNRSVLEVSGRNRNGKDLCKPGIENYRARGRPGLNYYGINRGCGAGVPTARKNV